GRVEAFFLDAIRASESPAHSTILIDRCTLPTSLHVDEHLAEDDDAHPVEVTLRRLSEREATPAQRLGNLSDGMHRGNLASDDAGAALERSAGQVEETVRAKYLVGCDGAHSWVRKTLGEGYEMPVKDAALFINGLMLISVTRGVLDIIPITDFPADVQRDADPARPADIRNRCMVHSADAGTLMVIPRENRLVTLYIQLKEVSAGTGRDDRSTITPDLIFKTARKILSPFSIKYHYIDW
ncbi:Phenol 2-monooxygenase, partial [Tolypocladium paradoxum]